jgi:hypothetical protein
VPFVRDSLRRCDRVLSAICLVFGLLPAAFLLLLTTLASAHKLSTGYWPGGTAVSGQAEVTACGLLPRLESVTRVTLIGAVASFFVVPVLGLIRLAILRRGLTLLVGYTVSFLFLVLCVFADPFGWLEWFFLG